ncbi:MAG: M20/M25/M40 family metallo-hydrolase, partial [Bacteroidales bacterium]|nr:M20/M25/M40 family metallo-hydrolase [Bacteroidales bacterium]
MKSFKTLKPQPVWSFFLEICKIPRASKREDKIIQYLLDFGRKYQLETKRDKTGNVLIRKPATKGNENLKPIVLQSHMDMVCDKNAETLFDFENDPIQPFIDGNWVKAKGTTLGADDGIGMATQLAILSSKDISHGPIECLFTVDEETGMTGAKNIKPGFFSGKILINLDSEDEGELFIGCAGGIDTVATLQYKTRKVPDKSVAYTISLTGLKGGHSGDEIHKGLGNSVKI